MAYNEIGYFLERLNFMKFSFILKILFLNIGGGKAVELEA